VVVEEPIVMSAATGNDESNETTSGSHNMNKPPDGGVDQDLWDILCEVTSDPIAISDCLAENNVFSLEDCVDMPNYRLGTFGVDDKNRRAIGRWVAKNGGPEFEEEAEEVKEEEVKKEGQEGATTTASDANEANKEEKKAQEPEKPKEPFDWVYKLHTYNIIPT
jgi:hypothetical protein